MRKISTFFYGIGQGIKNIRRNRMFSLASIATMAACLFLFGIFYAIIVNVRLVLNEAESRVGITVFFDAGISDEEIGVIGEKIRTRAEVAEIDFTSAEEAWQEYKMNKLSPELIETFGSDNPLEDSASYTVYLNDVTMQSSLVNFIRGLEGVRKVNEKQDITESLSGLNTVLTVLAVVIVAILLGITIFLISITISTGVSVRKHEISIMKLIGATDFFIRIPYVVEGIIIGVVGAFIPIITLQLCYKLVLNTLSENLFTLLKATQFVSVKDIMVVLAPLSLVIGIGIGIVGSNVTLGKQLKKIAFDGE